MLRECYGHVKDMCPELQGLSAKSVANRPARRIGELERAIKRFADARRCRAQSEVGLIFSAFELSF